MFAFREGEEDIIKIHGEREGVATANGNLYMGYNDSTSLYLFLVVECSQTTEVYS